MLEVVGGQVGVVLLWAVNTGLAFVGLAWHCGRWWTRPQQRRHEAFRAAVHGLLLLQSTVVLLQRLSTPVPPAVPAAGWVSAGVTLALLLVLGAETLSDDRGMARRRSPREASS